MNKKSNFAPVLEHWHRKNIKRITENGIVYLIEYPVHVESWYSTTGYEQLHRIGGPARTFTFPDNVIREYWEDGKLHNLSGPAIEGNNICYYYIHGEYYSKEDWEGQKAVLETIENNPKLKEILESDASIEEKILEAYVV